MEEYALASYPGVENGHAGGRFFAPVGTEHRLRIIRRLEQAGDEKRLEFTYGTGGALHSDQGFQRGVQVGFVPPRALPAFASELHELIADVGGDAIGVAQIADVAQRGAALPGLDTTDLRRRGQQQLGGVGNGDTDPLPEGA